MRDQLAQEYLQDLQERGLFESVEFLFKAQIIPPGTEVLCGNRAVLSRAINLLCMQEYYQVAKLLSACEVAAKERERVYVYCSCCSEKENFLRNYAKYLLAAIKQEPIAAIVVDAKTITSSSINEAIQGSQRMKGKSSTVFDSPVFDDPYLVYLLVLSTKEELHPRMLQKTWLYLIKQLPYFWEPYRQLAEMGTATNIGAYLSGMSLPAMRDLFRLYVGSKKCIMLPEFKTLPAADCPILACPPSALVDSMVAAILAHYKQLKPAAAKFEALLASSFERDNLDQYANVLYSLRDTEKLSSLLMVIYERYYNLPLYHYVAGNLLSLTSRHLESIEEYQQFLRDAHPGEFDIAYVFVAQEYYHLKDTCSAIKACNLAIKKNYNDYRVWSNMAQIYFSIDMYEYALHFFRKSAEISPDTPGVYEALGMCFDKLGKHDNALKCFEKGYQKGSAKALSLLANLTHQLKTPGYQKHLVDYLKICLGEHATHQWLIDQTDVSLEEAEKYIGILEPVTESAIIAYWRAKLEELKTHKR